MSKPISSLTQFQNQTGPIPLSQLDADLALLWNASNDMSTYSNYMIDSSGAPNSITVTPAAGLAFAYTAGIWIEVKVANTNTSTTVNINVNALGNQLVKNPDGTSPSVGQIVSGGIYAFQYDGTNFQIIGGQVGGFSGFANPTGSVGLTAVNGSATTAMRSDASPALSQSISPTWSGSHTFSNAITVNGAGSSLKGGVTVVAAAAGATLVADLLSIQTGAPFGSGANLFTGSTNALNVGTNGAAATTLITNAASRLSIASTGNVTINAPSSGSTLTINTLSGVEGFQIASSAGAAGTMAVGWNFGVVAGAWNIFSQSTDPFFAGAAGTGSATFGTASTSSANVMTNSANRIVINSAGNVTINAPSSGVATTINGASGTHSTKIADSSTNLFDAGYLDIPQNSQTVSYQLVISDRGKGIDFNGASLTCTIPANGTVAFPIGTAIVITNLNASALSIAITTDTLTLAGTTTTGTRSLAQNGTATIRKTGTTAWLIAGTGLT